MDAPQTPNISASLRSSAGRYLLILWEIFRTCSCSLLLHVFLSSRGRVLVVNARMKLPPIEVSISTKTLHSAPTDHWPGDPHMAYAQLCRPSDPWRCAPHRQLDLHRAGSDDCRTAHVYALNDQEMVWTR